MTSVALELKGQCVRFCRCFSFKRFRNLTNLINVMRRRNCSDVMLKMSLYCAVEIATGIIMRAGDAREQLFSHFKVTPPSCHTTDAKWPLSPSQKFALGSSRLWVNIGIFHRLCAKLAVTTTMVKYYTCEMTQQ